MTMLDEEAMRIEIEQLVIILSEIARGRADNGRPLGGETARQKAREVLDGFGYRW